MATNDIPKESEPHPPHQPPHREESTSRLEAFSDGVFAIAITLLVLNIHVPTGEEVTKAGGLLDALTKQNGSYLVYLISFATIGIIWLGHHAIFKDIRRADGPLLALNLLLLLFVSIVPFPTALLATYIDVDPQRYTATEVYGIFALATTIAFELVWDYASGGYRLLKPDVSHRVVRLRTMSGRISIALYAVALAISFFSPQIALAMYVLIQIAFLFLSTMPNLNLSLAREVAHEQRTQRIYAR